MELHELQAFGQVVIAASPEDLYSFISDMPRVGEVSPVCTGGTWESEARGVGATFIGSNTQGERTWQTRMRVSTARPSEEFAWDHMGDSASPYDDTTIGNVRWTYTFEPVEGGTQVTESWAALPGSRLAGALDNPRIAALPQATRESIDQTLVNLKKRFES